MGRVRRPVQEERFNRIGTSLFRDVLECFVSQQGRVVGLVARQVDAKLLVKPDIKNSWDCCEKTAGLTVKT